MKNNIIKGLLLALCLQLVQVSMAQISTMGIDVQPAGATLASEKPLLTIGLNHKDWMYQVGEEVIFEVEFKGNGEKPKDITYAYGLERMKPTKSGKLKWKGNKAAIKAGKFNAPSFIRCIISYTADGKELQATATAAIASEQIQPTIASPSDFNEFWAAAVKKSKSIGLQTKLTPMANQPSALVDVYQVEYAFENDGVQKFYGALCVPKKTGSYPAIIRFPGAGWVPLSADIKTAEEGYISLSLYIHGRPVNKDLAYYKDLQENDLKDYQFKGITDRDSAYYKNVILGCVRSVDLIYSLKEFDGKNVLSWGSSQGGALSIISTSLEPRIKYAVALCPAMCDYTGYLNGRAGGWPHYFAADKLEESKKAKMLETLPYYDVVNFAKNIRVPMYFSWGFNDVTTPPTSFYSAYNQVKGNKKLFIIPEGVHRIYPEQVTKTYSWLKAQIKP